MIYLPALNGLPTSLTNLIDALQMMPGIGAKTANRLAFFLLRKSDSDRSRLGNAILSATTGLSKCTRCFHFAEGDLCGICHNAARHNGTICVVEDALDLLAIEKTASFSGSYHVLGGALAPIEGVGPNDLTIDSLVSRIAAEQITELILATNPTLEGEATATLIQRRMKDYPALKITRIARGIPVGGDVEYADEVTLARAMENRRDF